MTSKFINFFFISIIILIFLSNFIISNKNLTSTTTSEFSNSTFHYSSNSIFSWPLFGYYNISSKFGYRNSPTSQASSFHTGIDIPASSRYKYLFHMFSEQSFLQDFYGANRILYYNRKQKFSNNLWTCFSRIYCKTNF